MKNIQFGYSIPKKILEKSKVANLRLFVSGENILTFTSLSKIFDPEAVDLGSRKGATYPFQKVYSFGLSVDF